MSSTPFGVEIMAPPGMEEMSNQLQNMFSNMSSERKKARKLRIAEARKLLCDEEAARLLNDDELKVRALEAVEQNGIVFLDEIDKVTKRSGTGGVDVSREGVQRDLLPLIEGCTVNTKIGMIKTDHILFIASGAFHLTKPSDLIPELQGRLPIRVELNALTPDGIKRIAEVAWQVNERTENIGARRLHTVMEKLLEQISFDATDTGSGDHPGFVIDAAYVDEHLGALAEDEDLSRYIL